MLINPFLLLEEDDEEEETAMRRFFANGIYTLLSIILE